MDLPTRLPIGSPATPRGPSPGASRAGPALCVGPISFATRVFLSRNKLHPGFIARALDDARTDGRPWHDRERRLVLQGPWWRYLPIEHRDDEHTATLESDPGSGNTLLKARRKAFAYREMKNGTAQIALFGKRLPDSVCLGLPKGKHLSELISLERDPFFRSSDPVVRTMRNAVRSGRRALVLTVTPVWAAANWRYHDRDRGWLE